MEIGSIIQLTNNDLNINENINIHKITRLVVVDHRKGSNTIGRLIDTRDVNIEISVQDDDQTLKIFMK